MRRASLLSLIALAVTAVLAQRPTFEVASVKQNKDGGPPGGLSPRRSGDLVSFHNTQLYTLIYYAYHLTGSYQMVGFPLYGNDPAAWFDVEARTGGAATDDDLRLMMQSLLEDRFKLKVHRESRDLPGYELAIAKDKARLTPSSDKPMTVTVEGRTLIAPPPGRCGTSLWRDGAHMMCHAVGIDELVAQFSNALGAPVADRTALMGSYDLHLRFMPENQRLDPNSEPGPSLTQALEEELGLTLVKGKAPVDVLVIDHLEKLSEN